MVEHRSPRYLSNRRVAFNKHRLAPQLTLPSAVAWSLAYEASRRNIYVADLIVDLLDNWAADWRGQLAEAERLRFVESIPFHRGPYRRRVVDSSS